MSESIQRFITLTTDVQVIALLQVGFQAQRTTYALPQVRKGLNDHGVTTVEDHTRSNDIDSRGLLWDVVHQTLLHPCLNGRTTGSCSTTRCQLRSSSRIMLEANPTNMKLSTPMANDVRTRLLSQTSGIEHVFKDHRHCAHSTCCGCVYE